MAVTLESLKKSVGRKNSKSKIFAWLADLELAAGNLDAALQRVNGGLTLYPNDIAAKLVRAKILFQKEESEECIKECENILVMDPFNLAAQKIMGDAYDKLGNVAERNLCYRRFHDMDPLNKFWKDEYDVTSEPAPAPAEDAIIAAPDFSMLNEGDMDFGLSESEEAAANLFEKSKDNDEISDEPTLGNLSLSGKNLDNDDDSLGGGLFEKSSEDMTLGKDSSDLFSSSILDEESAEKPAVDENQTIDSGLSLDEKKEDSPEESAEDPFAALAAMLPNNDAADDATVDELSASLDSVMDSIKSDPSTDTPVEEFPVDDNVSSSDVGAALSDMFGLDDDLEADETPAAKPADFGTVDVAAEENASKVFETPNLDSDKPLSVDDAFASIFGEDELPEELPTTKPAVEASAVAQVPAVEVPAAEPALNDALDAKDALLENPAAGESLFEKSAQESVFDKSASESVFEKSASDSIFEKSAQENLEEKAPVAESVAPVVPAEDKPVSVDDAFASIFGEDELPEELPAANPAEEASAADVPAVEAPVLNDAPASDDALELPEDDLSLDDVLSGVQASAPQEENPKFVPEVDSPSDPIIASPMDFLESTDLPTVEPEEESENLLQSEPQVEKSDVTAQEINSDAIVGSAFDSIFGEDELPASGDSLASDGALELPEDNLSLEDVLSGAQASAPQVETKPDVNLTDSKDETGVSAAFDSIFGDDDDLPVENSKEEAKSENVLPTMPAQNTLAEQVNNAEAELELPSMNANSASSDLAQEMGGAFASMFGDDDDLDLPEIKSSVNSQNDSLAEAPQATSAADEERSVENSNLSSDLDKSFDNLFGKDDFDLEDSKAVAEEKPVAGNPDLASLESEVSGAFKGLFDMEDDSLEESKPANSGVDFLMSGDSDDEISAGLIKNADAPLNRGALNLDDSMGTRTLAEIYFDQGLYADALKMYQELIQREPNNQELLARKNEIEKIYHNKFGGNA